MPKARLKELAMQKQIRFNYLERMVDLAKDELHIARRKDFGNR